MSMYSDVRTMRLVTTIVSATFLVLLVTYLGFTTFAVSTNGRSLLDILLFVETLGMVCALCSVVFASVLAFGDLAIVYANAGLLFMLIIGDAAMLAYLILGLLTANRAGFPGSIGNDPLFCCEYYQSVGACADLGPCDPAVYDGSLNTPLTIYMLLVGTIVLALLKIVLAYCVLATHEATQSFLVATTPAFVDKIVTGAAQIGASFSRRLEERIYDQEKKTL